MMRVLVTGGAGHVGRAVTERLIRHGWEVRVIGMESGVRIPGAEFVTCDITSYAQLRHQMRGCQAVVHLAAIPNPRHEPGHEIFRVNASGTFNVFEAAAAEGIRRIVQASSINAMGCAWSTTDIEPRYLPIDEDHPSSTTDPYSFSKKTVEEIGDYYWRRDGISSVALRLPAVWSQERRSDEAFRQHCQQLNVFLDAFSGQPEDERASLLAVVRQRAREFRRRRLLERPHDPADFPPDDPLWKLYTIDRFNFWAWIDERDSAQAVERSLSADYEGSHVLFAVDRYNYLGYDSRTLARLFFPEVSRWKQPVQGSESLISLERARKLIGYQPEYSMQPVGGD